MAIRFDGRITGPNDLSKYTEWAAVSADRLQCVPDPIGQRGYVLRARRQVDDTPVRNGYRAEAYATGVKRLPPCVEWYEWESLFLRSEFQQGWPNPMIFLQIHDDWSGGGAPHLPPVLIGIAEGAVYASVHSAATQNPALPSDIAEIVAVEDCPVVWDKWARFVVRVKFALDGTGEFDLWYDGARVCALRAIHNCYPDNALYVQTGAYSGLDQLRSPVVEKAVYSTGVRIFNETTTHAEMGVSELISLCAQGALR